MNVCMYVCSAVTVKRQTDDDNDGMNGGQSVNNNNAVNSATYSHFIHTYILTFISIHLHTVQYVHTNT